MTGPAVDLYGAAFIARHGRDPHAHRAPLIEPGVRGLTAAYGEREICLLVIDDRAYGRLAADVATARQGVVSVFETAAHCDELMGSQRNWKADRPSTAMVCRDIHAVPATRLPDGLTLRAVIGFASEAEDAVPLEGAVAVAVASDPGITQPTDEFARFLSSLPSSVRLFAAVDAMGVARATSGCDVVGDSARVFFVNTEPRWRRLGIGRAMTAEALRAAASSGAAWAVLDATDSGASVYPRLGFEVAGRLTRYWRAG